MLSCILRACTRTSVPSCILRAHTHVRACLVAECRALSAGGTWRPPFLLPAPSLKECLKGEYSLRPLLSKNANSWKVELAFLSLLLDNERECVLEGKVTRWPPHTLTSPPSLPLLATQTNTRNTHAFFHKQVFRVGLSNWSILVLSGQIIGAMNGAFRGKFH